MVLTVAIDAMAIYVEKTNPLEQLTVAQVDAIFSMTRYCGAPEQINDWQQLNINKFGANGRIQIFGRNSASGTYDLFKGLALCNGDYAATMNEMPSSSSVVQSVASSIGGIGYAALGHPNKDVKALAISQDNTSYYAPSGDNIRDEKYPFTRYLYLVVNKPPNETLPTLERTFLNFVLSQEGQQIVSDSNYYAVTGRLLERQRRIISENKNQ